MEAEDALPLTVFYDPPEPLGARPPGALIRSEAFQGYSLPPGAHAVRILYVSRALDGTSVAASGVVLIPAGSKAAPRLAGYRLGTRHKRQCPHVRALAHEGRRIWQRRAHADGGSGFAVVATDYAGLGTPGGSSVRQ